jgi:stage V sporulation protein G
MPTIYLSATIPTMDTTTAVITVLSIIPLANAGKLLALADVELVLDDVPLIIHGIQVRADGDRTEITLPKYRSPSGEWKTAITLPDEVRGVMGDMVIAAGIEAGLLKERVTS